MPKDYLATAGKAEIYCRILGVTLQASEEEIKTAFRVLAKQYHPDVSKLPKAEAEARFQQINEAYTFLSENGDAKENRWREAVANAPRPKPGATRPAPKSPPAAPQRPDVDFDDLMEQVFRDLRAQRNAPLPNHPMFVDVREAMRDFAYMHQELFKQCERNIQGQINHRFPDLPENQELQNIANYLQALRESVGHYGDHWKFGRSPLGSTHSYMIAEILLNADHIIEVAAQYAGYGLAGRLRQAGAELQDIMTDEFRQSLQVALQKSHGHGRF